MTTNAGAGAAPAANTDARPAETAQDIDTQLSDFITEGELDGPLDEQAAPAAADDQAKALDKPNSNAEQTEDGDDPENLFGETAKPTKASTSDTDAGPAKLKLADGTEVTAEQVQSWRDGGFREADYTRKTQELAEQRKAYEARTNDLAAREQSVADALERALAVVEAYVPPLPTHELALTDPARYTQEMAIHEAAMRQVKAIAGERSALAEQAERRSAEQRTELLRTERERLYAAIPELKDTAKRQAFNQEMVRAVEAYGFSEADYAQIVDHRLIRVLADAARYQRIKAASAGRQPKPDTAKAVAAPQPAGRRAATEQVNAVSAALQQAKRTGTKTDSSRAIEAWLSED